MSGLKCNGIWWTPLWCGLRIFSGTCTVLHRLSEPSRQTDKKVKSKAHAGDTTCSQRVDAISSLDLTRGAGNRVDLRKHDPHTSCSPCKTRGALFPFEVFREKNYPHGTPPPLCTACAPWRLSHAGPGSLHTKPFPRQCSWGGAHHHRCGKRDTGPRGLASVVRSGPEGQGSKGVGMLPGRGVV